MIDETGDNGTGDARAETQTGVGSGGGGDGKGKWNPLRRLFGKGMSRKACWWLRLAVGTPVLLLLATVVLAIAIPHRVVLPLAGRAIGLELAADRVLLLDDDLDLVIEGLRVRVPGIEGPAGEIARASRVVASYDWTNLFSAGIPIDDVELTGAVVRISQNTKTGDLNLEKLEPPARGSGGSSKMPRLPRVILLDAKSQNGQVTPTAAIEVGEHADGSWTRLWRVPVTGSLRPATERGKYAITLTGQTDAATDETVSIEGETGVDGTRLVVQDVGLEIDPSRVPSRARETFASFNLRGRIPELVFDQRPGGDAQVNVRLDSVSMNLPFRPGEAGGIRLERTSGELRLIEGRFEAELQGFAEDVPYDVTFETGAVAGVKLSEVPFEMTASVEDYVLTERPPVVPFLPRSVRVRLDQFSNPTGLINGTIRLSRAAEGGRLMYEGQADLREGRAAYHRFPYPVEGITGRVRFDADALSIEDVIGRTTSGATVRVSGAFSPLDGTAGVDLNVSLRGLPLDEEFQKVLSEKYGPVHERAFSPDGFEALVDAGLIRRPGGPGWAPEFEMGGTANLDIRLRRQIGEVSVWTREFDLGLPEIRVVPEWYKAPIVGKDVAVSFTTEGLTVRSGTFENVLGGTGTIVGTGAFGTDPVTGEPDFQPSLVIEAVGLEIGESTAMALDGTIDEVPSDIIRKMRLEGETSGVVRLLTGAGGSFDLEIEASLDEVTGTPGDGDGRLRIEPDSGTVFITEDGTDVVVKGRAFAVSGSIADQVSPFEAETIVRWGGEENGRFEQRVRSPRYGVELPVESVAGVFSPELAATLGGIREAYRPTGSGAASIEFVSNGTNVEDEAGAEASADDGEKRGLGGRLVIDVSDPRGVSALLPEAVGGGRLGVSDAAGAVRVAVGGDNERADDLVVLTFTGWSGRVSFEDEAVGLVDLDGTLDVAGDPVAALDDGLGGGSVSGVRFGVTGADVGSKAVERLARIIDNKGLGKLYDEFRPRGVFDASAVMTRGADGVLEPRGEARPSSFSVVRSGERVGFEAVDGVVRFEPNAVLMDGLSAVGDEFVLGVDGAIRSGLEGKGEVEGASIEGDVRISVAAEAVTDPLRLLMPTALRTTVDGLLFEVDGAVVVPEARVLFSGAKGEPAKFRVVGETVIDGGRGKIGVPIEGVQGRVSFDVAGDGREGEPVVVRVEPAIDELVAAKVRVRDIRGVIATTDDGTAALGFDGLTGTAHGGRVAVGGRLERDGTYTSSLHVGGVSLAGVQSDLERAAEARSPTRTETGAAVSGLMTVGGTVGDPESVRGRGELSIAGGTVLDMPLTLALLQAGHFQVPLGQTLDDAGVRFYFDGGLVTFDEITLSSQGLSLFGFGTMTLPELVLDLRFITRSSGRVPLVSTVVEGLRDELVTATIKGPVSERQIGTEQFAVTRRLFRELFDLPVSAEDARFEEVRRRVGESSLDRWRWQGRRRVFDPVDGVDDEDVDGERAGSGMIGEEVSRAGPGAWENE